VPALPKQLTAAASICMVLAFFALIYIAEWVPGLLPYSPNFGHSSGPVGSVAFPVAFLAIALVAATTAFLIWRVNRFALVTLPVLWLIRVGYATYSCTQLRQSCGPRGTFSIAFLILCGGIMLHAIWRNWPTRR
jgi:hypothetical protein